VSQHVGAVATEFHHYFISYWCNVLRAAVKIAFTKFASGTNSEFLTLNWLNLWIIWQWHIYDVTYVLQL